MANALYNRGKKLILDATDLTTADLRVLLLKSGSFDADHNFVSDLTPGTNEQSGGTYVRKALANESVTEDDTNNIAKFDADDVTWTALSVTSGNVTAAVVYKYNAADASAELVAWIDTMTPALPFTPNGGDWTIQWHANGIFYL